MNETEWKPLAGLAVFALARAERFINCATQAAVVRFVPSETPHRRYQVGVTPVVPETPFTGPRTYWIGYGENWDAALANASQKVRPRT